MVAAVGLVAVLVLAVAVVAVFSMRGRKGEESISANASGEVNLQESKSPSDLAEDMADSSGDGKADLDETENAGKASVGEDDTASDALNNDASAEENDAGKEFSFAKTDTDGASVTTDGSVDISSIEGFTLKEMTQEPISSGRIRIVALGSYSGLFFEDGSDEEKEDIFAVVVTNTTDRFLQYSEITFSDGNGKEASFSISNIPSGASCLALEKNAKEYAKSYEYQEDVSAFIGDVSLHRDVFSWEIADNILELSNNGTDDIKEVYVYYKNAEEGVYLGGITYRVRFEDLGAKEEGQELSKHLSASKSNIMMVDIISD